MGSKEVLESYGRLDEIGKVLLKNQGKIVAIKTAGEVYAGVMKGRERVSPEKLVVLLEGLSPVILESSKHYVISIPEQD